MVIAHDTATALRAATELVNSAEEPETMSSVADLDAHFERYGYTGRHDRDRAELEEVRRIRPVLRELLCAERDDAAHLINRLLARAGAVPQLRRHHTYDWHLHAIDDQAPYATRILVETAMAMIDLIRSEELSRLAVCADGSCEGLVLDLSRNRSRRYCSTACANRNAVAAYRARQAER